MSAPPRLGVTEPISTAAPSALDRALSEALESDLHSRGLYESTEEAVLREEARSHIASRTQSPHASAVSAGSHALRADGAVCHRSWVL